MDLGGGKGGTDWIHLAQDRDREYSVAKNLLASQEGLCSMECVSQWILAYRTYKRNTGCSEPADFGNSLDISG